MRRSTFVAVVGALLVGGVVGWVIGTVQGSQRISKVYEERRAASLRVQELENENIMLKLKLMDR